MLKELIKYITPTHLLGYLSAVLLGIVLCKLFTKKQEGFYSDPVINAEYSKAWGQDVFKNEDVYDKGTMAVSIKNPGKIMSDVLMGQQNLRQFFNAVYEEKLNLSLIALNYATIDLEKAEGHLKEAKKALLIAELTLAKDTATLAFSVAQAAYAAANMATIDPSVAVRAGANAAVVAVKTSEHTQAVKDSTQALLEAKSHKAAMEVEYAEYKTRFDLATVATAKAKKELNEVTNFLGMSREAEFLQKRFYPYATPAAAQAKKECDAQEPVRA